MRSEYVTGDEWRGWRGGDGTVHHDHYRGGGRDSRADGYIQEWQDMDTGATLSVYSYNNT